MIVETKLKAAWRKNLIRQLRQGRTLTESARLLRVGRSKIHQEFRRDPEFKREVEGLLGHPVDSIVKPSW